jgi:hypothetical protein
MPTAIEQEFALHDELHTSVRLIKMGLKEVRKIDGGNDFYHPLMMTLASGIERLMKVIICFHIHETTGTFPSAYPWEFKKKKKGHDLVFLLGHIINHCFSDDYLKRIPVAKDDIDYLRNDKHVLELVRILSDFGQSARYYNLDLIKGQKTYGSPKDEWQKLESIIFREKPDWQKLIDTDLNLDETFKYINQEIIIRLEIFLRSLSRLFSIGGLGQKAKQYSSAVFPFVQLSDEQLGKTEY